MGPKSEKEGNSNKYKKSDGRAGEQKARTRYRSKEQRQWNKDKPEGQRKFNKE